MSHSTIFACYVSEAKFQRENIYASAPLRNYFILYLQTWLLKTLLLNFKARRSTNLTHIFPFVREWMKGCSTRLMGAKPLFSSTKEDMAFSQIFHKIPWEKAPTKFRCRIYSIEIRTFYLFCELGESTTIFLCIINQIKKKHMSPQKILRRLWGRK